MDSTKIFLLIVGNALNIVLSLLFFYLIRLYFDIDTVGYYGVFLSFFTTFSFILDLGIQISYLKFYAESKNKEEEAIYNGTFLLFRLIQYVIYMILIITLIQITPLYDGSLFVVYLFFLAILFGALTIFEPILLSKKEAFSRIAGSISSSILKNVLLVVLANFFINDIWLLVNIVLLSHIVYFFLNIILIRKRRFQKPNREYMKKIFKYSLPFFLTSSLYVIVNNVDVLFIRFWSSLDDVANYFSAKQFFAYFLIIVISISNILISTFSKNISEGKEKRNIKIINYAHRLLNIIIIPIVFITILYGTDIFVLIFGEEYRLTGHILNIFIFTLIPLSLDCINAVHLQALGEVKYFAKFIVFEYVFTVFFMILFISPIGFNLGVFGGALSYVIAKVLIQIIYRPLIYKKFKLGFYWGSFRNLIIMLGIFFIQLWINNLINYSTNFILLFAIIDVFAYFLIIYFLKGFSKEDFRFIFRAISIKKIFQSISSELKEIE